MQELASEINGGFVKWILRDRGIPVESKTNGGLLTHRLDVPLLSGADIVPACRTSLAHGIDPFRIFRIGHHIESVTAPQAFPMVVADTAFRPDIGGSTPAAIILHAAHDIVGHFVVDIDMIELTYGQFFVEDPVCAAIPGDADTAVISVDDEIAILRMDPEGMVIRMDTAVRDDGFEIFTTVFADGYHLIDHPKTVLVLRITGDVLEIERSVGDPLWVAVDKRPVIPAVITHVQAVFRRLHQGIHAVGP